MWLSLLPWKRLPFGIRELVTWWAYHCHCHCLARDECLPISVCNPYPMLACQPTIMESSWRGRHVRGILYGAVLRAPETTIKNKLSSLNGFSQMGLCTLQHSVPLIELLAQLVMLIKEAIVGHVSHWWRKFPLLLQSNRNRKMSLSDQARVNHETKSCTAQTTFLQLFLSW